MQHIALSLQASHSLTTNNNKCMLEQTGHAPSPNGRRHSSAQQLGAAGVVYAGHQAKGICAHVAARFVNRQPQVARVLWERGKFAKYDAVVVLKLKAGRPPCLHRIPSVCSVA